MWERIVQQINHTHPGRESFGLIVGSYRATTAGRFRSGLEPHHHRQTAVCGNLQDAGPLVCVWFPLFFQCRVLVLGVGCSCVLLCGILVGLPSLLGPHSSSSLWKIMEPKVWNHISEKTYSSLFSPDKPERGWMYYYYDICIWPYIYHTNTHIYIYMYTAVHVKTCSPSPRVWHTTLHDSGVCGAGVCRSHRASMRSGTDICPSFAHNVYIYLFICISFTSFT